MNDDTITIDTIIDSTPTPSPNAQIVCYPTNGNDIKAGFYCVLDNQQLTPAPALTPTTTILTFDYNGEQWQTTFVDVWRPADVIISVFLGFICFFIIIKTILSIVIKKRFSIYKKVDK